MKKSNKSLVSFVLGIMLAISLIISFPIVASAEDYTVEEGVVVEKTSQENQYSYDYSLDYSYSGELGYSSEYEYSSDYVEIEKSIYLSTNEVIAYRTEDMDYGAVYTMDVRMDGVATSFQLGIVMPWFVNVVEITPNKRLEVFENAIWTAEVDEASYDSDCVRIAYSGTNYVGNMPIATVSFVFTDLEYNMDSPYIEDARFVNLEGKEINYNWNCGTIAIQEPEKTYVMGDANLDGAVTLEDVMVIQRAIVNPAFVLDNDQFVSADVNKDGIADIVDCQLIQSYLVGIIDSLDNIGGGAEYPEKMVVMHLTFITDKGEHLASYNSPWQVGRSYMDVIEPYGEMLMEIYGKEMWVVRVTSDVYGDMDLEKFDTYCVEREDKLVVYVEVEENGGEDSETVSISTVHEKGRDITFVVTSGEYVFVKGTIAKVIDEKLGRFYIHDEDGNQLLIENSEIYGVKEGMEIAIHGEIVRKVGYEVIEPALAYCKQVEIAEDMTFATVNDIAEVANGLSGYMFGAEYCVKGTIQEIYNEDMGACRIIDERGFYIDVESLCDVNGNPFWKMDIIPEVGSVITVRAQVCKSVEAYGEKYQITLANGTVTNCSLWEGEGGDVVGPNEGENVPFEVWGIQVDRDSDFSFTVLGTGQHIAIGTSVYDAVVGCSVYDYLKDYEILGYYYDREFTKEIAKDAVVDDKMVVYIKMYAPDLVGEYPLSEITADGGMNEIGSLSIIDEYNAVITCGDKSYDTTYFYMQGAIVACVKGEFMHMMVLMNGVAVIGQSFDFATMEEKEEFVKIADEYKLVDYMDYTTLTISANGVAYMSCGERFVIGFPITEYADGVLKCDGPTFSIDVESMTATPYSGGGNVGGGEDVAPEEGRETVNVTVYFMHRVEEGVYIKVGYNSFDIAIKEDVLVYVENGNMSAILRGYNIGGIYADEALTEAINPYASYDGQVFYFELVPVEFLGGRSVAQMNADGKREQIGHLEVRDDGTAYLTIGEAKREGWVDATGTMITFTEQDSYQARMQWDMHEGWLYLLEEIVVDQEFVNSDLVELEGEYILEGHEYYNEVRICASGLADISIDGYMHFYCTVSVNDDGTLHLNEIITDIEIVAEKGIASIVERDVIVDEDWSTEY